MIDADIEQLFLRLDRGALSCRLAVPGPRSELGQSCYAIGLMRWRPVGALCRLLAVQRD